jgi:hypothetical protein
MNVIVDCESGEVTTKPMSDTEVANLAQIADEAVAARALRDAAAAQRQSALKQLKQQARAGGKVDAATLAQLLGVDPNSPDPAQPPAA